MGTATATKTVEVSGEVTFFAPRNNKNYWLGDRHKVEAVMLEVTENVITALQGYGFDAYLTKVDTLPTKTRHGYLFGAVVNMTLEDDTMNDAWFKGIWKKALSDLDAVGVVGGIVAVGWDASPTVKRIP